MKVDVLMLSTAIFVNLDNEVVMERKKKCLGSVVITSIVNGHQNSLPIFTLLYICN